jgi:basic membrane lipoprotein Med (substrate-binding protein (PBP1-ABC) superfamily)
VILVSRPDGDFPQKAQLEKALAQLAEEDGLHFETRPVITPDDLTPNVRLVVVLPPDPGLAGLSGLAPKTQFLGIGIPGLTPGANLSLISPEGYPADQMGFLAGYLAAAITPEWRTGAVTVSDSPAGVQARQGFLNGVVFFCGLCQQTYTPFYTYPMYAELPEASTPQEWQAAGDVLLDKVVKTAFIAPGAGEEALLSHLAQADVQLIGAVSPPASVQKQWVASIIPDMVAPLEVMWSDLMAGKGGLSQPASITIADINPDLFSAGRQSLVEKLAEQLASGAIDTGVSVSGTDE